MRKIKDKYDCFYLISKVKQGKTLFFPNDDELKTMVILQYDMFSNKYRIQFFNPKIHEMVIDIIDENKAFDKLLEMMHLIRKGYILE